MAEPAAREPLWEQLHRLYYDQLCNQRHMLADRPRMRAYHRAITGNPSDFHGRSVLDLGTGTGILALFAAAAGAARVYAVEASAAAEAACALVAASRFRDRIQVIQTDARELELPEQVDVLVSEPLGVLLLHERMLDTLLSTRDRWLKPGGKLYPERAVLSLAPIEDVAAYCARQEQSAFWAQRDFFGVDLSCLSARGRDSAFECPLVGHVSADKLVGTSCALELGLRELPASSLARIDADFHSEISRSCTIHGLAGWFDAIFTGSETREVLTTSPSHALTHWQQTRLLFSSPLYAERGDLLKGKVTFTANEQSSYGIEIVLQLADKASIHQCFALQRQTYW